MKTILITGTPGSGKSELVGALLKRLKDDESPVVINVSDLVKEQRLYDGYSHEYDT
jgi:broad-specificity NMP kinase